MAVMKLGALNPRADFFDFNLKCLLYVGLWREENWSAFQKILYKIYEVFLLMFAFIFMTITAIGLYFAKDDYVIFLTNMDKTIAAYNYVFKIIVYLVKRNEIETLVTDIIYSGDRVAEKRKKLMAIHVPLVSGMIIVLTGTFQFLAHIKGEMMIDAWFPFDTNKNKFTLFLAGQILAILFLVPCMLRAISIQGLVCSIIMYLCDQLADLQVRFRKLRYSKDEEAHLRREFKCIIKKHIRLMGYSKSLSDSFETYFLIQNLAVTCELCLNALMISFVGLEQKKHLITFLSFLMMALFNAYIFCYLGNEIMDKSAGIALAAYESSWTSWPVDLQKDILLVITVSQRSFKLTAGGIAFMSMETFAQNQSEIITKIKLRQDEHLAKGLTCQPLIVVVGSSIGDITDYYVHYE